MTRATDLAQSGTARPRASRARTTSFAPQTAATRVRRVDPSTSRSLQAARRAAEHHTRIGAAA